MKSKNKNVFIFVKRKKKEREIFISNAVNGAWMRFLIQENKIVEYSDNTGYEFFDKGENISLSDLFQTSLENE